MSKYLRWVGIALAAVAAVIAIALSVVYLVSEQRLNQTFQVELEPIEVQSTEELIDQGEHIAVIRGCTDCHSQDLGGSIIVEDPMIGTIASANLTSGQGGVASAYSDAALARAIRHGVDHQAGGLLIMPSEEYFILSDGDVAALIAYIRSLPPVDRSQPEPQLTLMARALYIAGQLPPLAAEVIDHSAPHPQAPAPAANAAYGQYLASSCIGCHGADYGGGTVPGAPPDSPQAANLTPAGELSQWSEAEFMETLRTGVTPNGEQLDPSVMPWPGFAQMSDLELKALWAFLQSLPPVENN